MKLLISGGVCAALGLAGLAGVAVPDNTEVGQKKDARPAQKSKARVDGDVWMKAKQQHAQDILVGLTSADFGRIEKASQKMIGVHAIEKWLTARGRFEQYYAYYGQMNAFEYSTKELWRFSKQKDINGALNAYVTMTRSCVRCHSLIREAEEEEIVKP